MKQKKKTAAALQGIAISSKTASGGGRVSRCTDSSSMWQRVETTFLFKPEQYFITQLSPQFVPPSTRGPSGCCQLWAGVKGAAVYVGVKGLCERPSSMLRGNSASERNAWVLGGSVSFGRSAPEFCTAAMPSYVPTSRAPVFRLLRSLTRVMCCLCFIVAMTTGLRCNLVTRRLVSLCYVSSAYETFKLRHPMGNGIHRSNCARGARLGQLGEPRGQGLQMEL